ncbi:MAG: addiction module toxin RelE [Bacteroidaceae bacterium]|nr:addiction module toxin RelE [Bacteroidaceae bacterium]
MNYEIRVSSYFLAEAKRLKKRYRSFLDDLEVLKNSLLENPEQGVELSPGIRKVRMSISSKGRGVSGGARVITYSFIVSEKDGVIVLLLIYDKSDASSVKLPVIKKIIRELGL